MPATGLVTWIGKRVTQWQDGQIGGQPPSSQSCSPQPSAHATSMKSEMPIARPRASASTRTRSSGTR